MTRWAEIAKDRGGSYWEQVQRHLWAMVFFSLGFLVGMLAAVRYL